MEPLIEPTEAEKYFDQLLKERREKGRKTYGVGLPSSGYDWQQMALEEALDLAQYLAARNKELEAMAERLASTLRDSCCGEDSKNPDGMPCAERTATALAAFEELKRKEAK